MKRFYVTAAIAGAMFFSVESATAQETQSTQSQTATEQTQQKDEFKQIEAQEISNEVRKAVERDYQGATIAEAYSKEKDGETKYKIVVTSPNGQSQELYADAQGIWIDKERANK